MNANEVIAKLAGEGAHPNDHVNMGQSSNDVFPSAVHLAALDEVHADLLPAMDALRAALERKADEFADVVKAGRTHLMDAVPVTLGQEFGGYAAQIRLGAERVSRRRCAASARSRSAAPPPAPASTPTRSSPPRCASSSPPTPASTISAPPDPFEAQGNRDALVELSGALKVVAVSLHQDRQRPRADGLRAARRARRAPPARAAEGLLDHARQGQPGDPRGGDPGRRPGDRQRRGDHGRRQPGPVRAQRARAADRPQPARLDQAARRRLARCSTRSASSGIEANEEMPERHAEATLATATALNPHIGYDRAAEIVKEAAESGRSLREVAHEMGVDERSSTRRSTTAGWRDPHE